MNLINIKAICISLHSPTPSLRLISYFLLHFVLTREMMMIAAGDGDGDGTGAGDDIVIKLLIVYSDGGGVKGAAY